ncbi:LacI family DNA-binding transcriptional regulator [Streptomyces sp. NPDC048110]|uniref:LacI family DNA-binding transcriptional regulator n=1 Tax=Streptomyces sp. NPDC048110 TaxID=3155483 RepID=UPI0033C29764
MKHPPRGRRGAPTSRDVAALAGVAQSTVSAAINGGPVAPDTKRRIEEAMRMLKYQPNAGARTLRTNRTNAIAMVVHLEQQDDAAETVPYIDTVVEIARRSDYDVVLSTLREGVDGIARLAGRAICDGFLVMDVESHDARVGKLAELGVPAVLMGRPADPQGLDVVDLDTREAGRLLVDELADTGHRRVAMLAEPEEAEREYKFISDFVDGVRARAAERGLALELIAVEAWSWPGVQAVADRLLDRADARLGLIARTPRVTQWFMNLLQLRGLIPGRDISVVSRCTDELAESFAFPVSNVSPQPREMSRIAMEFLIERLGGNDVPARTVLVRPEPPVRRTSTAISPS